MSTKRIIVGATITGLSLLSSVSAFASLDSQFSQCAATALQAKSMGAEKISVDLPTNSVASMDHDTSSESRTLKMNLENSKSGEFLCSISCRVNSEGNVESVRYLTQAS